MDERHLEIMRILWKHSVLKPSEILERLAKPIKNSALRWQLSELLEGGHLAREKRGKAFYYRAVTPKKHTFRSLTDRLEKVFFSGSSLAMIGELIDSADLTLEEIEELQAIALRKAKGETDSIALKEGNT